MKDEEIQTWMNEAAYGRGLMLGAEFATIVRQNAKGNIVLQLQTFAYPDPKTGALGQVAIPGLIDKSEIADVSQEEIFALVSEMATEIDALVQGAGARYIPKTELGQYANL